MDHDKTERVTVNERTKVLELEQERKKNIMGKLTI
jgi:hypothetical protein